MNATGDYWIYVSTLDQTKEYAYVADVVLNKQEVLSALTVDSEEAEDVEKIKICSKSYLLARIRLYPDEPEEVQEIINYSKGHKIRLTFLERLLLFIRKN